jgi:hypothetical protein
MTVEIRQTKVGGLPITSSQENVSRHRLLKPWLRRQIMEHDRITLGRIA